MSLRTHSRFAAALLLAAGALGCELTTGPDDFISEFALVSLASQELPVSPFSGSSTLIIADTLRLRSDGTGERSLWSAANPFGFGRIGRDEFTWRVIGDRLEVSFPCEDTVLASCIAPPHLVGRFQPGPQWVVPHATIFNEQPAVYQRVSTR